jgi:hypothetical protein
LLPPFRLFVVATVVFFLTLQLTDIAMVAFKMKTVSLADLPPAAAEALKKRDEKNAVTFSSDKQRTVVTMDFFVPADQVEHVTLTPEQRRTVFTAEDELKAEAKTATPDEAGWLSWIQSKAKRVQEGYERALADPMKLNGPLNVWLPRLMLFLVPIFALLLAVVHWWPKVYFIEHLVFSTHIHTVVFVALSLLALSAAILGDSVFMGAVWLILAIYLWMAMYRVYGRSWWLTSIKFLALLMVYSVVLSVGMGLVLVAALSEV